MKQVEMIPLKRIRLSDSRPTVPDTVNSLASSIEELGLIQPITVRKAPVMDGGVAADGYEVVAGNHRVAALRALGWAEIEAFVLGEVDRWDQEMREIDENLIRAELTAAQRASAIRRRKALWEQRHPKQEVGPIMVEQDVPSKEGTKGKGNHLPKEKAFAADTAERTGQTKQAINRHVSRAEALGEDLDAVTGTSLDKGVELDALKAMPPEERAPLIERARAGEQVSARQEKSPSEGQKASSEFAERINKLAKEHREKASQRPGIHQAKVERVGALLNTSAQDASSTLNPMAERDPAHCLELCAGALVRLNATRAERISHRKAFASAARKALKHLEKGPQS